MDPDDVEALVENGHVGKPWKIFDQIFLFFF